MRVRNCSIILCIYFIVYLKHFLLLKYNQCIMFYVYMYSQISDDVIDRFFNSNVHNALLETFIQILYDLRCCNKTQFQHVWYI